MAAKSGSISIPIPKFLQVEKKYEPTQRKKQMKKHGEAYEAFCKWSATPPDVRKPKTAVEFEKLWKLPTNYTSYWKKKEDFLGKKLEYFWKWTFDKLPDVMYHVYRRAKRNSTSDAKVFLELIGKKLEVEKPQHKMTPFMMVGVPQEKIDNLFVSKDYEPVIKKTIELNKTEEAEVIDVESA